MNNKLKPALIGGVVIGLLSVIPFVSIVNVCCCLWAILGGMLASYLYVKGSPTPANAGDGAIVGAFAGLVGAVIYVILGIPIALATGPMMRNVMFGIIERLDPRQADLMRQQVELADTSSIASVIIYALVVGVLIFVFSIIGGLIGIPLFEKRKTGAVPPPPTNLGGPGGYPV